MDLFITFTLFAAAAVFCLLRSLSLAWALALTLLCLCVCALRRGVSPRQILGMIRSELPGVLIVVRILCFVGLLTGLWRSCGTIAFFIRVGMGVIPPQLFLLLTFLLTALLSFAIGTNFGVTSTAGIMLIALARAGGVSVPVTAGVILSGVIFGDRGAPTSSCAALSAALTHTDHYANVRHMMKTAALPLILTLGIYTVLSLRHPLSGFDGTLLHTLDENFSFSWLLTLPALIMLVLPLLKVALPISMGLSALCAFVLTVALQRISPLQALGIAVLGYAPDSALAPVLSGGGFFSMVPTMLLLLCAGGCTAIIRGLHLLDRAQALLLRLSGRIGRFAVMFLLGFAAPMIFCNQTIAMIFCAELAEPMYGERARLEMMSDLSCSVVPSAALVPWCISCSVPLAMLGAGLRALPFACYLYLLPLCYFFTKRFYFRKAAEHQDCVTR